MFECAHLRGQFGDLGRKRRDVGVEIIEDAAKSQCLATDAFKLRFGLGVCGRGTIKPLASLDGRLIGEVAKCTHRFNREVCLSRGDGGLFDGRLGHEGAS